MSYQVIARKWRPQRFSDMVGQEHIARTLRNAIKSGRIANAYLFVGPRGIGKTTSARIFAKALNCTNPQDGEPCCECASCRSIADETNVDVIEIDAATHTQVDKARELCEDVLHLPIASKYKIYIIDEVHMLSKSAWNALLKTIEEPPAHAKFIFATTEVNKVLPTVISRCQRFDLRRIKVRDIAARLRFICDAEHVGISDSAIRVIAQAADGGMRDAQSLLDQLISFFGTGGSEISEQQALTLFGLTAPEEMKNLLRSILANDRISVVTALHSFAAQSKNLDNLYEEIVAWLRAILLCRILPDPAGVLEETPEKIAVCTELAQIAKPSCIQRLLENLSASGFLLRDAINKQVFLESILLKAMRIAHAAQIEDLIARLNQIRKTGELDALNSVVPLYEVPPGQIVTVAGSAFAPAQTSASGQTAAPAQTPAAVPEKKTSDETVTSAVSPALPQEPEPASEPPKAEIKQPSEEEIRPTAAQNPETFASESSKNAPVHTVAQMSEQDAQISAPEVVPTPVQADPEPISSSVQEVKKPDFQEKTEVDDGPVREEPPMDEEEGFREGPPENEDPVREAPPVDDGPVREGPPGEEMPFLPGNAAVPEMMPSDADGLPLPSPDEIWQKLILDVRETLKKSLLAGFMLEGTPEYYDGSTLHVAFDQDYETMQCMMVEKEIVLLNSRLREISENPRASILLARKPGLATAPQIRRREDLESLKKEAVKNPAVAEAIRLFSGHLTDVYRSSDPIPGHGG